MNNKKIKKQLGFLTTLSRESEKTIRILNKILFHQMMEIITFMKRLSHIVNNAIYWDIIMIFESMIQFQL